MSRQSGITTRQMMEAQPNAYFVWPNNLHHYPRALAKHLDRDDLEIVSQSWIRRENLRHNRHVVVDHACELDGDQSQLLHWHYMAMKRTKARR